MSDMTAAATDDDAVDGGAMRKDATQWLNAIRVAQKDAEAYRKRCSDIQRLYQQEAGKQKNEQRQYQIFWSTIQTLQPSIYAHPPKPVVQSRWRDGDPVVRLATVLLERALSCNADLSDWDTRFKGIRDDYLLYARGIPRLRYEPVFEPAEAPEPIDDFAEGGAEAVAAEEQAEEQQDVGDEAEPSETLAMEHVRLDWIHREDFIVPVARSWEELPWIAYRSYLGLDDLKSRFSEEIAGEIPRDAKAGDDDVNGKRTNNDSADAKAVIYEIWDRTHEKVIWAAQGYDFVLEESEPHLKVTGFFPTPKPAYGTCVNGSIEPTPDYVFYQDQVAEINTLTARIASLTQSLKVVGFYPAGPSGEAYPEIERALKPGVENVAIGVKSWAAFKIAGNDGPPLVFLPVEQIATIIRECIELRKQLIDDIYQITGISDILRGDTEASETATAQSIKAQWGSIRVRERQAEIERVARDCFRMAAEIMATQFQVSTLVKISNMKVPTDAEVQQLQQQAALAYQAWQQQAAQAQYTGVQPPPAPQPPPNPGPTQEQVETLLKDGVLRRYLVDVETDSTIASNESQEKQDRAQFVSTMTQFIQAWGPIIQQEPMMGPLAAQLMLFGVRAFRTGRELEETIETTLEQMQAQLSQPKPPPQPSPDEVLKTQAEAAKTKATIATSQIRANAEQTKAQLEVQQAALDHHVAGRKAERDMAIAERQHQMDIEKMQMQAAMQAQQSQGMPPNG